MGRLLWASAGRPRAPHAIRERRRTFWVRTGPKILHWCRLSCAKVSESSMKMPIWPVPRALKVALFSVFALVSLSVTLRAAEGLRIVPLVRDDRVLVTFELA